MRTQGVYSKDQLRSYLRNISNNEGRLRDLSRYLFYRCQPYYRLIKYNANMFVLNARSVIPNFSLTEDNDPQEMLKQYEDTICAVDKLNQQYEFLKVYVTCFREDVFFGCLYFDETGAFILPLDPDYCKITGLYPTGDFGFAMDMAYFRNRQELLEIWGDPFKTMYREYERDTVNNRWISMPAKYAVCLKARPEDWETVIPPYVGLLNSIINLVDLEDIQAIADEQSIYKLVWLELETMGEAPDDWKVDPALVIGYFNRLLNEALPPYVSGGIVPGKLNTISFDNDATEDTNKVSDATKTIFNTGGGAQILNSATISGTTAFNAAILADTEFAISALLPQTQSWVNRILPWYVTNPGKVKFAEISVYTLDKYKESIKTDATQGLPTKLLLNSLNGFNEIETLAINELETNILKLHEKFIPLQNSYTMSGTGEAGAPTKSDTEITDAGEAARDSRDTARG